MLRRLYDWTLGLAEAPGALRAPAPVSFIEKRLGLTFAIFLVLLFGGFAAAKRIA